MVDMSARIFQRTSTKEYVPALMRGRQAAAGRKRGEREFELVSYYVKPRNEVDPCAYLSPHDSTWNLPSSFSISFVVYDIE